MKLEGQHQQKRRWQPGKVASGVRELVARAAFDNSQLALDLQQYERPHPPWHVIRVSANLSQ